MIRLLSALAACALFVSNDVHASDKGCEAVGNRPGVYAYMRSGKVRPLRSMEYMKFIDAVQIVVVPRRPKSGREQVWNVQLVTTAIEPKRNAERSVTLKRNGVMTKCVNNEWPYSQKDNYGGNVSARVFEHDDYANGAAGGIHALKRWHFAWRSESHGGDCVHTRDYVERLEAHDGVIRSARNAHIVSSGSASAAVPVRVEGSYVKLKAASVTAALVHRGSTENGCLSIPLPGTKSLLGLRSWTPSKTVIKVRELGARRELWQYTINWTLKP